MIDYLCHPVYRYVIFMLIMYSVFKSTPNLNVTNKMLTHLTLLTTVMIYIMDNVTKLVEKEKKKKKKNKKKDKYTKPENNFAEKSIKPIIKNLKEDFTQKKNIIVNNNANKHLEKNYNLDYDFVNDYENISKY